jgi:hypothetical protein
VSGFTTGDTVRIAGGIDRGRLAVVAAEIPREALTSPGPVFYKTKINHGGPWEVPSVILCDLSGRVMGRYPVDGLDRVTLPDYEDHPREDPNAAYLRTFRRDPVTGCLRSERRERPHVPPIYDGTEYTYLPVRTPATTTTTAKGK